MYHLFALLVSSQVMDGVISQEKKKVQTLGKTPSGVTVGGEGGVAGEGRLGGVPNFHSWVCKCAMILNKQTSLFFPCLDKM